MPRQWEEVDQDTDNAVLGLTGPGEIDTDPLGLGATVEYVGCMYAMQMYVLTLLLLSLRDLDSETSQCDASTYPVHSC